MNRLISSRSFSANAKLLKLTEEFPFKATLTPAKAVAAVTKESKLASGVRIISRENNAPVATIKFAVLGGSSSEKAAEKGVAHFLAASAFSGNARNTGIRFVRAFENLGADVRSHVDREKIVHEVNVLVDRVDEAFTALAATVASGPYAHHIYNEEVRPIAAEQYHEHHDTPRSRVTELLHEAAYGETSPLGSSLYALSPGSIDLDVVEDYRKKHFVADNIIVTATGVSHDKLKSLVEAHIEGGKYTPVAAPLGPINVNLGQIPLAGAPSAPFATPSPYVGGFAKETTVVDGETHVGLAFATPAGAAIKPYLVLKSHLASKFGCENFSLNTYTRGGLISYFAQGEASKVGAKIEAVIAELKAVASGSVDIKNVKSKAALHHFLRVEGEHATCTLLNAHLNGTDAVSFGDVRNVSQNEVVEAAKAVLKSTPSVAVLGITAHAPTQASVSALWK